MSGELDEDALHLDTKAAYEAAQGEPASAATATILENSIDINQAIRDVLLELGTRVPIEASLVAAGLDSITATELS